MGSIIDYVKEYGDYSLEEKPFCDVDSLVLAQFSYLKLDGLAPGIGEDAEGVEISGLETGGRGEGMFADERYAKVNRELFQAMRDSRRFGRMRLNYYENRIDPERESQFSAVTCFLETGLVYVAFRGTDETIVGWREDFNMAFQAPVRGQLLSVSYLERAAEKFQGDFFVGGHSKGGNFAVYAAMNCGDDVQKRIIGIYSHDGPGFRPEILESHAYDKIEKRVRKIIPHSSVVGMILENHEEYEVVESRTFGMLQHNPFTWIIREGEFVRVKDLYHGRKLMDEVINKWILSLDEEHLQLFVESLFQVVSASEAETLIDFTAEWKKSMNGVLRALKEIDGDTKKKMRQILGSFFRVVSEVAREHSGKTS